MNITICSLMVECQKWKVKLAEARIKPRVSHQYPCKKVCKCAEEEGADFP